MPASVGQALRDELGDRPDSHDAFTIISVSKESLWILVSFSGVVPITEHKSGVGFTSVVLGEAAERNDFDMRI